MIPSLFTPIAYTTPEELEYMQLEKLAFMYRELHRDTAIALYTQAQVEEMLKDRYEAVKREREDCAKVGDEHQTWTGRMCAAAIRARGEK